MKRTPFLALAAALACGSVDDRPDCSTSADCPVGLYCAHTPDGNVCWEDAVDPVVSPVTVACVTPCPRDGLLTVSATVTDDVEVFQVVATLDLDASVEVPLARVGDTTTYQGQVDLAAYAFPVFSDEVTATVTARDGARNEVAVAAQGANVKTVTRVRWSIPVDESVLVTPTAPAIAPDGTVVVGGDDKLYFITADQQRGTPLTVAAGVPISQAPSIGTGAIWVVAGTRVFAVALDGSAILNGAGCDVQGTPASTPAVSVGVAPEVAFAASSGGRAWVITASATSDGCVDFTGLADPYVAGPVVDSAGRVLAVSASTTPEVFVRQFTYDGALTQSWGPVRVGEQILSQPSVSASDACWVAADDGGARTLEEVAASGVAGASATLSGPNASAPAVLSGGDLVLSTGSYLRRFAPDGTPVWNPAAPQLGGVGLAPIVLTDGANAFFLVPTRSGTVHAVASDGAPAWGGTLALGQALGEGNLHTPPGSSLSYAYFTSADGRLHQVVVDGVLDTSAPWPKAWHDPRNTSNAASGF